MTLTPERTRCHGILWHDGVYWQRCPKATDCARYQQRYVNTHAATLVVKRACASDDFERFLDHA